MVKQIINFSILALLLMAVQVLVCNNISIFGIATPFIFIYLIIRLPITLHINWTLTIAFFSGLIVDIFSDTQGMNAMACTLLGALRIPIFNLYTTRRDEITNPIPSTKSLGIGAYLKYMLTMTLCYCFIIVCIDTFSLHGFVASLLRIAGSTAITFVILLGIDSIVNTRHEKRL